MTTRVTLTGTGIPPVEAGRAGAGCLIRVGDPSQRHEPASAIALQFDAGRATSLRLAEAGQDPTLLDAIFVTHHHSDHVSGIPDLIMAGWLRRPVPRRLTVVAPNGPSVRFLEAMLTPYAEDIAVRAGHTGRTQPRTRIVGFEPVARTTEVWAQGDVRVLARPVHHEPVTPAVAYRVETPDGSVVISGDTRVCDELEDLARSCDVLVHEAFRVDAWVEHTGDASSRVIGDYHADTVALGAMAARVRPGILMLTHLVPPPRSDQDEQAFADDIRAGGFSGPVLVGRDLTTHTL